MRTFGKWHNIYQEFYISYTVTLWYKYETFEPHCKKSFYALAEVTRSSAFENIFFFIFKCKKKKK